MASVPNFTPAAARAVPASTAVCPFARRCKECKTSYVIDKSLARRLVILALFLIVLFGAIFGWRAFVDAQARAAKEAAPPPEVSVSVASVEKTRWPAELQATASLNAVQGTMLTPQIAGIVTAIHFHSGDKVKQGQLLVQFNDANERAQRKHDMSERRLAKIKYSQQRTLYHKHSTSQLNLQKAETDYAQAKAAVSADAATIAKLQIRAPFTGHLGLRQVSLGEYVDSSTSVVDLQQWKPIYVDFQVPQQQIGRLQTDQTVLLSVPGLDGAFKGQLTAVGSKVQPGTRNVSVQATFANAEGKLRPGMYGSVTVKTGQARQVLTVPESAVTYNTYGSYVYVVEQARQGRVAKERHVKTGASRNGRAIVKQGVKVGDKVVTAGQVKLHSGARVKVVPPASSAQAASAPSAAAASEGSR
jgi:membrane fusion protein (multidrug efflux system)